MTSKHPEFAQAKTNKADFLNKVATIETVHDLEYLNWVVMETLRMQTPASSTSFFEFTQDTKIDGLRVRKGDEFMI